MKFITKMYLLLFVLMTPVILLFVYSTQLSTKVITNQINIANEDRLSQFMLKIEGMMDQVSNLSNLISKDPDFTKFALYSNTMNRFEYATLLETIEQKLGLFSLSVNKMSRINVYLPPSRHAVSSDGPLVYDAEYLKHNLSTRWTLRTITDSGITKRAFTRHFVQPYQSLSNPDKATIIVEVDLMEDNLISLLDEYKLEGNNDPFFYDNSDQFVYNDSANVEMAELITKSYDFEQSSAIANHEQIRLDDKKFLVYFNKSEKLNWTVIDYVPLQDILAPVTKSRQLFYIIVAILLTFGAVSVILLHLNVQLPIKHLTESVLSLKRGNFSERFRKKPVKEFQVLVFQFNEMAKQIQHLVEKVYLEEIRSNEAVMKQLQSQINPHFLHNSLAYIVSMAKMNRTQPVISMAYSLADYYKYTTRNVTMTTTVRHEIAFVTSYIDIMNYQLDNIQYSVDVPDSLLDMPIPRLLIQPIVENAIVHGLESKLGGGSIRIAGIEEEVWWSITVTDDGMGLSEEECAEINLRLDSSVKDDGHVGLWNVNQRLRYQFGSDSGVKVSPSDGGGLKVELRWKKL
ncbi:cache domain-containing sensor histidine kinase [Cohnella herbarum]|uniref:Histidine kinase n=1 Tax=Cohnella herbarum TaxID=2728023 RepID=A0A7Z2VGS6_9BACL|nr:sensor histidine kinase [Cohnella herbarum]QJD82635.1 histidine kinase [Cohnella herbarum]